MKDNYFDNPNTDENRKQRAQKKKKTSASKIILIILGMIIITLAAFVVTIKIIKPDFDLLSLLPGQVVSLISNEDESEKPSEATTREIVTETTTEPTTASPISYLPIEDFKTDEAKKGNQLGNILNGGLVGSDMTYIYHIVNGDGIYRFEPNSESYTRIYKTADKLCSLNLRGEYLYFINTRDNKLYRLQKSSQSPKAIAEEVKTAYIYDNRAYYVTTDNRLCTIDLEKLKEKLLYDSVDEEMELVGVSLKRVFFTVEGLSSVKYLSVDIKGKEKAQEFTGETSADDVKFPVMENGYLYSYNRQSDGSYNLCRKKYGSESSVVLAEKVSDVSNYPITDTNRVFYSELDGGKFSLVELNMNSNKTKVMLSVGGVKEDKALSIQHGYSYDFIIGKKSEGGKNAYSASGIYTSSTNVMSFKDGSWSY